MRAWLNRAWMRVALMSSGSVLALGGCDPTVRDTVLGGVESASTTLFSAFIQAFFETLEEDEGSLTTVRVIPQFQTEIFA